MTNEPKQGDPNPSNEPPGFLHLVIDGDEEINWARLAKQSEQPATGIPHSRSDGDGDFGIVFTMDGIEEVRDTRPSPDR